MSEAEPVLPARAVDASSPEMIDVLPAALLDELRAGRAVLVVGAGVGGATWTELLAALIRALETRGQGGDEAAARDLARLVEAGNLVRAMGYLARALGGETCDRILADAWREAEPSALVRVIAELPFRHVWTTFPGDVLERGLAAGSPEGWPPARVATYDDLGELSRRRRTLVKVLGHLDTFVVAPGSVRRALSRAVDLRSYARDCYVEGTLVFVGFRVGDPDLSALLDRVFGMFEPPRGTHYLLAESPGPVAIDELMADHHIAVVALGGPAPAVEASPVEAAVEAVAAELSTEVPIGPRAEPSRSKKSRRRKGTVSERAATAPPITPAPAAAITPAAAPVAPPRDPEADAVAWLTALRDACAAAGITLDDARPAPDDLEGWLALAGDGVPEAGDALDRLERDARDAGDRARLIEILLARIELTSDGQARAGLLGQVAEAYQATGDRARALDALTTAWHVDPDGPAGAAAVAAAERLAIGDDWGELVAEASAVVAGLDGAVAATWWTRLGRWYAERMDRADYAATSLRRALELDGGHVAAHAALASLLRGQQRWAELADALRAHAAVEPDPAVRVELWLAVGELCETQLAASARAVEAYRAAADVDVDGAGADDAWLALERIYRREERWSELAGVLDCRAELAAAAGDSARAAAVRRELAALRADRLGDIEGAIARCQAALAGEPGDRAALRALGELYQRAGRIDDHLQTLERLAEVAVDDGERLAALRALAAGLEDRPRGDERALAVYQRMVAIDPSADDAHRALVRLHAARGEDDERLAAIERHLAAVRDPAQRAPLLRAAADGHEQRGDADRAIEHHLAALELDADDRPALAALARLYRRTEAWERAVEALARGAALAGADGAGLWAEAGQLALDTQNDLDIDLDLAERHLERALALDGQHAVALGAIAEVHRRRGSPRRAIDALVRAAAAVSGRLERVALLVRAAELADDDGAPVADGGVAPVDAGDADRDGLSLWERVLRLEPEHVAAGEHVADRLVAAARWDEAIPVLSMLTRRAPEGEPATRARREAQLGLAYAELHRAEPAARHFRRALEIDADHRDAGLGLAATVLAQAQATDGAADAALWPEVDRLHRDAIARHGASLSADQVADLWLGAALAARAGGDLDRAETALDRALSRAPGHAAALQARVDVAGQRGDWAQVIEARRAQLEPAPDARKVKLLEEIGDIARSRLQDPTAAVIAYSEALDLAPESHVLLHKRLDVHTEQRQWRRALDDLDLLAAAETSAERRARYLYAAAVIARDELADGDLALERLTAAVDAEPTTPRAFDAIERLLGERGDWRGLARAYRRMLKRVGDAASAERLLALWSRLGEVCLEHLGDTEAAIAAFEVAADLATDGRDQATRREQLVELYLEAGEPRRGDAIAELQTLLERQPERVELYKMLAGLYRAEHELDKAWCCAQALVVLGAADADERALYDRHRRAQLIPVTRRLTDELWQRAVMHPREDRHVGAIFASTLAALAATTARPPQAFGLEPQQRADLERDQRPAPRLARYAAQVLALDPAPMVWLEVGDAVRIANTVVTGAGDRARLMPSLLVGGPTLARGDERELAFELGKRMAYLRPERYASVALPSLPGLEAAFYGALRAAGGAGASDARASAEVATGVAGQVSSAVLEQVAALSNRIADRLGNGLVAGWRSAADLTANRAGLVLCDDLEVAARAIATETAAMSGLAVKDRLRDLLAYAVSEPYFQVRRHLGLHVHEDASA